jgi:hypothetical protein
VDADGPAHSSCCNSHDRYPDDDQEHRRDLVRATLRVGKFIVGASCLRVSEPACPPPRALVAEATQVPAVLCEARLPSSVRRASRSAADWVRRNASRHRDYAGVITHLRTREFCGFHMQRAHTGMARASHARHMTVGNRHPRRCPDVEHADRPSAGRSSSHWRHRSICFLPPSANAVRLNADLLHINQVDLGLSLHFSCYTGLEFGSRFQENCQPSPHYRPDDDGDGKHETQFLGGARRSRGVRMRKKYTSPYCLPYCFA